MSLAELEKLKFDWNFVVPGFKTTRCCATGTCDIHINMKKLDVPQITKTTDNRDAHTLKVRYGSLRRT
jgi:hypothetical protein